MEIWGGFEREENWLYIVLLKIDKMRWYNSKPWHSSNLKLHDEENLLFDVRATTQYR